MDINYSIVEIFPVFKSISSKPQLEHELKFAFFLIITKYLIRVRKINLIQQKSFLFVVLYAAEGALLLLKTLFSSPVPQKMKY
jgi:hypothetical protein